MEAHINTVSIQIVSDDITNLAIDAIVISTTPALELSGEIGARVLQKGGPTILDECDKLQPIEVGQAVITTAGTLPSTWVIHAAGPRMGSGGERGKLASAVWNSMRLAVKQQVHSLAFTPISIGQFGYPIEACASVMAQKIVDFTYEEVGLLSLIMICLEDSTAQAIFEKAFLKEISSAQNEAHARN